MDNKPTTNNLIPSCAPAKLDCSKIIPIEGSASWIKPINIGCKLNLNVLPGQKLMYIPPPVCKIQNYKVTGNCCDGDFWKYQKTHHQDVIIPNQHINLSGII